MSIEILWEDRSSLVVNKPPGLLTQGAAGIDTLETRLRDLLKEREQHPGQPYIAFPHRIDRPVSGVLLVARNLRAVQRFGGQFQSRKIVKTYWAIVSQHVGDERATWVDCLRKIPDEAKGEVVPADHPDGRQAILHWEVIERFFTASQQPLTKVKIQLETGRMHQIRLQFASRGFPLLGDQLYGSNVLFGPPVLDDRQRMIALHARSITFRHPTNGLEVTVEAPFPDAWNQIG